MTARPANSEWQLPPVGLLALCPLIAAGNTLLTAACLALLFLISLLLVSVSMGVLGRSATSELRILVLLLVSGVWVTMLDLVLQAIAYPLWAVMGVFLPLMAANSLLLAVGEQSLRAGNDRQVLWGGLRLGGYAALWLAPIGLVREVLGTGAVFSDSHLLPVLPGPVLITPFTVPVLQTAPGALLALALVAALIACRAAHST